MKHISTIIAALVVFYFGAQCAVDHAIGTGYRLCNPPVAFGSPDRFGDCG